MAAVNHMFEKKLKPQLLEQAKKSASLAAGKEVARMARTIMDYILCIRNPEWAAATIHRVSQDLPPGQAKSAAISRKLSHGWSTEENHLDVFFLPTGIEKTKSLKFCLALGEKWLQVPELEVSNPEHILGSYISILLLYIMLSKNGAYQGLRYTVMSAVHKHDPFQEGGREPRQFFPQESIEI